jgi:hypothetical protein
MPNLARARTQSGRGVGSLRGAVWLNRAFQSSYRLVLCRTNGNDPTVRVRDDFHDLILLDTTLLLVPVS